jgi:opacity protein-like surface antigen
MAADAHAQQWCDEEIFCYEDSCSIDEKNLYAKFLGGANFLQNTILQGNHSTYQTGYIVDGSLGFRWNSFRLEAEYAFRRNALRKIHFALEGSSDHGHFQASSYMGNLFWNLPLASPGYPLGKIQPFIGAGLGYDFQQMHASNSRIIFNQKWHHLSWQLMAGLSYPIFCHTEISLEYKFHQGGCHFYNHSIAAGLTYNFAFLSRNSSNKKYK